MKIPFILTGCVALALQGCGFFEEGTIDVELTGSEANTNAALCSSLFLTNQFKANYYKNGTSPKETNKKIPVTLKKPRLHYRVYDPGASFEGDAYTSENIAYGATRSIDIPLTIGTLVNPFFQGAVTTGWTPTKNKTVAADFIPLGFAITPGTGTNEGLCGYVYFYTIKNAGGVSYVQAGQAGRTIARGDTQIYNVIEYNVREDMNASEINPESVSERIKTIKAMVESVKGRTWAGLVKDAGFDTYNQKRSNESWAQATARALAHQKMKAFELPASETLATAVADIVSQLE